MAINLLFPALCILFGQFYVLFVRVASSALSRAKTRNETIKMRNEAENWPRLMATKRRIHKNSTHKKNKNKEGNQFE